MNQADKSVWRRIEAGGVNNSSIKDGSPLLRTPDVIGPSTDLRRVTSGTVITTTTTFDRSAPRVVGFSSRQLSA